MAAATVYFLIMTLSVGTLFGFYLYIDGAYNDFSALITQINEIISSKRVNAEKIYEKCGSIIRDAILLHNDNLR